MLHAALNRSNWQLWSTLFPLSHSLFLLVSFILLLAWVIGVTHTPHCAAHRAAATDISWKRCSQRQILMASATHIHMSYYIDICRYMVYKNETPSCVMSAINVNCCYCLPQLPNPLSQGSTRFEWALKPAIVVACLNLLPHCVCATTLYDYFLFSFSLLWLECYGANTSSNTVSGSGSGSLLRALFSLNWIIKEYVFCNWSSWIRNQKLLNFVDTRSFLLNKIRKKYIQ